MTQKLLTLPFRLGFGAARTAFDISAKTIDISVRLAGTATQIIRPSGPAADHQPEPPDQEHPDHEPESPQEHEPARAQESWPARASRERRESRVNGHAASAIASPPTPPTPTEITPPDEQPATPLTPQQDAIKTLAEEDEVVAEFAEPGAEDGAGAQLDVEQPWDGYAEMNAGAIIARIDQADPAELAVLELYEQTHRKRQTVLNAAAKRLRALSPPDAQ